MEGDSKVMAASYTSVRKNFRDLSLHPLVPQSMALVPAHRPRHFLP